jgi:Zn-finger nucleic acid-binding protein
MTLMTLACPHCRTAMRPVSAPAITGYLIALDQCPQCGGIWCDRWEMYPLTAVAAVQLDSVDLETLRQAVGAAPAQLECPRCRARMLRFHDASVTADARIERCPNCDGMWFNRGELRRFKEHARGVADRATAGSAETSRASASAATEADIERLAQQLGQDAPPPTVGNLSAAFEPAEEVAAAGDLGGELASGAAWMILRILLRLLLHI